MGSDHPAVREPVREAFPQDETMHPSHYVVNGLECLDVIESLDLNHHFACAFKYIWRAGRKTHDPLTDIKKAVVYLERWIKREEGK